MSDKPLLEQLEDIDLRYSKELVKLKVLEALKKFKDNICIACGEDCECDYRIHRLFEECFGEVETS